MQELISVEILGISSPEEAAKHADVVALVTNPLDPFFSRLLDSRRNA